MFTFIENIWNDLLMIYKKMLTVDYVWEAMTLRGGYFKQRENLFKGTEEGENIPCLEKPHLTLASKVCGRV